LSNNIKISIALNAENIFQHKEWEITDTRTLKS